MSHTMWRSSSERQGCKILAISSGVGMREGFFQLSAVNSVGSHSGWISLSCRNCLISVLRCCSGLCGEEWSQHLYGRVVTLVNLFARLKRWSYNKILLDGELTPFWNEIKVIHGGRR